MEETIEEKGLSDSAKSKLAGALEVAAAFFATPLWGAYRGIRQMNKFDDSGEGWALGAAGGALLSTVLVSQPFVDDGKDLLLPYTQADGWVETYNGDGLRKETEIFLGEGVRAELRETVKAEKAETNYTIFGRLKHSHEPKLIHDFNWYVSVDVNTNTPAHPVQLSVGSLEQIAEYPEKSNTFKCFSNVKDATTDASSLPAEISFSNWQSTEPSVKESINQICTDAYKQARAAYLKQSMNDRYESMYGGEQ